MEHFESPFVADDFARARTVQNQRFFSTLLDRAKRHRYFTHPFLSVFDDASASASASPDFVLLVLTSVYQLVRPFTALLCTLGGQAPTLRARFALMDNLYEEMGRGDLDAAHPNLYLRMLGSIGVTEEAAESMPTLPSIRRINDHLRAVVEEEHFAVGCAMLAVAEAVIPPTFPVFSALAVSAFPHVDMAFFDRHGTRDEGHSDDASCLFAISADASHYGTVELEAARALDYRSELFDDWMRAAWRELPVHAPTSRVQRLSERPPRLRPGAPRPHTRHRSVPPAR